MTNDTLLTREIGLAERVDPTGKKWDIELTEGGTSLYRAVLINDEGETVLPRSYPNLAPELSGLWTNRKRGLQVIDAYLVRVWDMSDATARRNSRGKAPSKEVNATEELDIIAA